jgi:hypothetical protein
VPLEVFNVGYPRERCKSGSGVPLEVFIAGYPRERCLSGSGVPLGVFIAGYPRERCISGSGAGEPRYTNGRQLCVAVPAGFPDEFGPRVPSHRAGSFACRVLVGMLLSPFELSMKGTPAIEW